MEWGTIGGGKWEWGGKEKGGVRLQATWDQSGQGVATHAKEGFQVSNRDSGTG